MSGGVRTVVFAGGGTGGHLYPALAIAERLPKEWRTRYLCSSRAIDAEILSKAGVEFTALDAVPPGRRPGQAVAFVRGFVSSFRAAREVVRTAARDGEVAVVAMGGFVCPPAALAARGLRVPVTLVNLDAEPGKANRFVDRFAVRVFTAAEGRTIPKDWTLVGPILRRGVLERGPRGQSRSALGLDPNLRTLFVSGGSQGAGTINEAVRALVERDAGLFKGWQVYHQAGPGRDGDETHLGALRGAYEGAGVRAVVVGFCDQMGHAWNAADLAVCRSGAGTVAEVVGTGTPAVFLPYPHHADAHQRKNAAFVEEAGGAVILTDHIDAMKNLPALRDTLTARMREPGALDTMRSALQALAPMDGAAAVGEGIAW